MEGNLFPTFDVGNFGSYKTADPLIVEVMKEAAEEFKIINETGNDR